MDNLIIKEGGSLIIKEGGALIIKANSFTNFLVEQGAWLALFFIGLMMLTSLFINKGKKERVMGNEKQEKE